MLELDVLCSLCFVDYVERNDVCCDCLLVSMCGCWNWPECGGCMFLCFIFCMSVLLLQTTNVVNGSRCILVSHRKVKCTFICQLFRGLYAVVTLVFESRDLPYYCHLIIMLAASKRKAHLHCLLSVPSATAMKSCMHKILLCLESIMLAGLKPVGGMCASWS